MGVVFRLVVGNSDVLSLLSPLLGVFVNIKSDKHPHPYLWEWLRAISGLFSFSEKETSLDLIKLATLEMSSYSICKDFSTAASFEYC